ncbi:unnamed protein product [Rhizoctonia solani]|uniref:Uncharacterized protein n=1 Tax=Rhizoctonia solani TaxID=456999 RepID=A0A8H3A648_9AGAM|nr:unnamed protein product [Rhizoctonia solani]CAE6411186.1 unnamed protein product [Rhizoctonia solani]
MDTQPKPTQVTKQPEPMTEMTTKHDPPTVSDEIERPSGKVNEDTPSKVSQFSPGHNSTIDATMSVRRRKGAVALLCLRQAWMDYARLSSVHYAASVKD